MKGILGYFILGAGLCAVVLIIVNDVSWWWSIIGFCLFGCGFDWVIDNKIKEYHDKRPKSDINI